MTKISISGTIFTKATQILGYADDLGIMSRDFRSLHLAVDVLVDAADDGFKSKRNEEKIHVPNN